MEVSALELLFERLKFSLKVVDLGLLLIDGFQLELGDLLTSAINSLDHQIQANVAGNDVKFQHATHTLQELHVL